MAGGNGEPFVLHVEFSVVAAFGTVASTAEVMEPWAVPSSEDGVERVQLSIITFPSCQAVMEKTS